MEKQTKYSFLLPNVSDNGARIRGPRPRKTTKPVVAPTTVSFEVFRSSAIWAMPGTNIELASGLSTAHGQCLKRHHPKHDLKCHTCHERYDSDIDQLPRSGPISWVFIVPICEIDDLWKSASCIRPQTGDSLPFLNDRLRCMRASPCVHEHHLRSRQTCVPGDCAQRVRAYRFEVQV